MVAPPAGGAGVCGGSDREWMYESVGYNVCLLVLSAAEHSPQARSFDLEVTPWAPPRLASCIFHPGPTEAYEPLRSTLCPARTPFRDLAAPGSARMPPVCRSGISQARSFDLEVTPWAPTRLTSCISHPGPAEAYERLRSTLCPARAPFRHLAAPESTRKPLLHTRGISRARSFDLEVTPWAPTRLTSCISHTGPEESSGAPTWTQAAQVRPGAISPPRNRPASLCCTPAAFPGPEASTWR